MVRLVLLYLFLSALVLLSWKDWYKSLCGLILLMAVIEHPDMPKNIFGIQGLNPWNVAFLMIGIAWVFNRRNEGLQWDMPRHVNILLLLYLGVVVIGFARMMAVADKAVPTIPQNELAVLSKEGLVGEYLINSIKWVVPGLLLYDGCRSRSRLVWGLAALLGIYLLLGIQVIKWMPISEAVSGTSLTARSLKILKNEIGYHRVNLSMMLAGASWAFFAVSQIFEERKKKILCMICALVVLFAQALTAGRAGYATWAVVGFILCAFRWRKSLFLVPVAALLLVAFIPGIQERMMQGFTAETRDYNPRVEPRPNYDDDQPDIYTVTAGRNVAWPYVVDKIMESPLTGYGRQAMLSTGIADFLWERYRESFPHPHNAYLEILLDSGLIGFLIVMTFFAVVLKRSVSLFTDASDPIYLAAGGVAASLILALLAASIGSQTFYPREGAVGMWCAIGLVMRVSVERARFRCKAPATPGGRGVFGEAAGNA